MNQIVELEDIDLARVKVGEARAYVLQQPPQLLLLDRRRSLWVPRGGDRVLRMDRDLDRCSYAGP
jgi:hypothetical protein